MHPNHETCERIFEQWHLRAMSRDVESLLDLYHPDAVLESPLIPRLLDVASGICRGHDEIRRFFVEGTRRRPNDLVRWHRTGRYFCDGRTVIWEYPRETPDGDQVDLVEVIDFEVEKIRHHRIYWGWFGARLLKRA